MERPLGYVTDLVHLPLLTITCSDPGTSTNITSSTASGSGNGVGVLLARRMVPLYL